MRPPKLAGGLSRAASGSLRGSSRTMDDTNGVRLVKENSENKNTDHHHDDDHHSACTATTTHSSEAHTADISMSFSQDEETLGGQSSHQEEKIETSMTSPQQELIDLSSGENEQTDEKEGQVQLVSPPSSDQQPQQQEEESEEEEVEVSFSTTREAELLAKVAHYRKRALKQTFKSSAEKALRRKRDQSLIKLSKQLAKYHETIESQKETIETLHEEVQEKEASVRAAQAITKESELRIQKIKNESDLKVHEKAESRIQEMKNETEQRIQQMKKETEERIQEMKNETDLRIQEMTNVHEEQCNDYHRQLIKSKQEITSLRKQVLAMKQHQYQRQGLFEQQKWIQQQEELHYSQQKCEQLQKQLEQQQRDRHQQVLDMVNERFERLKMRYSAASASASASADSNRSISGSASPPLSSDSSSQSSVAPSLSGTFVTEDHHPVESITKKKNLSYYNQLRRSNFARTMRRLRMSSTSYAKSHPLTVGYLLVSLIMVLTMSVIFHGNNTRAATATKSLEPQSMVILRPDMELPAKNDTSTQIVTDVWGNTFLTNTTSAATTPTAVAAVSSSPLSSQLVARGVQERRKQQESKSKASAQAVDDQEVHTLFDQLESLLGYTSTPSSDDVGTPNRVGGSLFTSTTGNDTLRPSYWNIETELVFGMQLP